VRIGSHEVGHGAPVFIVAELSCNHGGNYKRAVDTLRMMAEAGADAVKLQVDNPDGGITVDSTRPEFRITTGPWAGKTLHQLYRETYTPWDWVPKLTEVANALGMECFATPSCLEGVRFLQDHGAVAYKISSFEITDQELISAVAGAGKPCLLSLGCAMTQDIRDVVEIFEARGNDDYLFLECVSQYPANARDFRLLRGIQGISDHSLGHVATWAAVALGAMVVERHFILSRGIGGPDAGFSLEPEEFAEMVTGIRAIEASKMFRERVADTQFCKSLFAARDIAAGEMVTRDALLVIRPGLGAHPRDLRRILGKVAVRPIEQHEPVHVEDVG
jgi:pseudaminic acid synthase